jgi:SWI/SNF-related matrix-associated actin-dependent regulator 1 of chromatin subfamily A
MAKLKLLAAAAGALAVLTTKVLSLSASPITSVTAPSQPSRALFPFQEVGVARLVSDRRLLLADDMGLGKTVQSISAINSLFCKGELSPSTFRVLIICPKSVVSVWVDELEEWIDDRYVSLEHSLHVVSAGIADPLDVDASFGTIQIINYDICHRHRDILQNVPFDVLICDEAHYLKSPQTQRTDAILGIKEKSKGIQSRYTWFLSGTPILNRLNEIYPLLFAINKDKWNSYYAFKKKYAGSYDEVVNLGQLKLMLRPSLLRRKKVDVLKDLPPKLHSVVSLEGSEGVKEREQEFAFESYGMELNVAQIKDSAVDISSLGKFGENASSLKEYGIGTYLKGTALLSALAKVRSITSSFKLEPSVQLLKQYIMCEKVVVFAHHRQLIMDLVEAFGDSCVHIIGGMDAKSRAEAVQRFQNDASCRLFIGSIRAAGVGLTLTASSHVVFLELDWSPSIMTQAEDRCHRVGQQDSVLVEYFVFKGSLDEWMARQLAEKSLGITKALSHSSSDNQRSRPEYKLNFGKYSGYSLDEVPIKYISGFLIKDEVYKKKPALWNALYRNDMLQDAPPSLVKDEENGVEVLYTFDFGQYTDMSWSQVPSSYRDWIIKEGVWKKRTALWIALYEGGLVEEEPQLSGDNRNNETTDRVSRTEEVRSKQDDDAKKVEYIFDFGKFNGHCWNEVDEGYRSWIIKTKDVWQKRDGLWSALYKAGVVEEKPPLRDEK